MNGRTGGEMVVAGGRVGKPQLRGEVGQYAGGRRGRGSRGPRRIWVEHVRELALKNGVETDSHRLEQRQKQIDFGKNTIGYDRYRAAVPLEERSKREDHPLTPQKEQICSKRSWDAQVRRWRTALHKYDPEPFDEEETELERRPIDEADIQEVYDDIELDEDGNPVFKTQDTKREEPRGLDEAVNSPAISSPKLTIYDEFEGR